jgi:acetylornithine deacetylase/succinyl-diaminopimelate desuccinylase-like protein
MTGMTDRLQAYIESARPRFETRLRDWVGRRTVSSSPDCRGEILTAADAIAETFRELGARAAVVPTRGLPVLTASFGFDPSRRTVLIYNHMDVQPADEPEWRSSPFDMQIDGDTYRGRGTTDDKGPALSALLAARYAVEAGIPVNLKFVWEFEEEIGSPNFEEFVRENLGTLEADSVVISDTVWVSRARPAIPFGLRGLLAARLILETGGKDVHSGLTGGGARNPVTELCQIVAACEEAGSGRIRIPGFYDAVRPLDPGELDGFRTSGFRTDAFRQAHELKLLRSADPQELMRRIWTEPTFEVHGIVGGHQGPGVKTAIPPRAEAKVSMRLVPDQSPAEIFAGLAAFVRTLNPDVRVEPDSMLAPWRGPRTGPYREAGADAMRHAFGTPPAAVREGGSIGAVVTLDRYLRVPILFLGLSLPEHGYHAPNENFDWHQASGGIRMFVRYFENASTLPPDGAPSRSP